MKFRLINTAFICVFVASTPVKDTKPNSGYATGMVMETTEISGSSDLGLSLVGGSLSKRAQETFDENVQKAQSELDGLFAKLSGYVTINLFNFDSFESAALKLGIEIEDAVNFIQNYVRPDTEILAQATFVQLVYQQMIQALTLYKAFPPSRGQNNCILRNLIQLNVSLFRLRNQDGKPNPLVENYVDLVQSYAHSLEEWLSLLGQEEEVSEPLNMVIEPQLTKAQRSFQQLASFFPQRDVYVPTDA